LAHIVGNGTTETVDGETVVTRSNAHTLDWNGNAWYAGEVKAKGFVVENEDGTTVSAAAVPQPTTVNENAIL
jgi:hypothetical protein